VNELELKSILSIVEESLGRAPFNSFNCAQKVVSFDNWLIRDGIVPDRKLSSKSMVVISDKREISHGKGPSRFLLYKINESIFTPLLQYTPYDPSSGPRFVPKFHVQTLPLFKKGMVASPAHDAPWVV